MQIKRRGKLAIDFEKIAAAIAPDVVGHIKRRVASGLDIKDRQFIEYSDSYKKRLVAMGENDSHVDLWLTGGLLNSVQFVGKRIEGQRMTMVFSPDTGTSAQVAPKAGTGRTRPNSKGRVVSAASRTGQRGPEHNIVGYWLHVGKGRMPARPWLGISPTGVRQIMNKLHRLGLFRSR